MTRILTFPGQSSRYAAMLEHAVALAPESNLRLVAEASDILGRDMLKHYRADNPSIFATNRDVQVGVFLSNHLAFRSFERSGASAPRSLGLGPGEYNHLVHIGALDFAHALRLVEARGKAFDAHAHTPAAVDATESLSTTTLANTGFFPVLRTFLPALQQVPWQPSRQPYLSTVWGRSMSLPTPGDLIYLLGQHVYRPSRWRESIGFLAEQIAGARFVDVGFTAAGAAWRDWPSRPAIHLLAC